MKKSNRLSNYIEYGEILNACCQVKEVHLKRLYHMIHDALEKAKLGGKKNFSDFLVLVQGKVYSMKRQCNYCVQYNKSVCMSGIC